MASQFQRLHDLKGALHLGSGEQDGPPGSRGFQGYPGPWVYPNVGASSGVSDVVQVLIGSGQRNSVKYCLMTKNCLESVSPVIPQLKNKIQKLLNFVTK